MRKEKDNLIQYQRKIADYRNNPCQFVYERFGVTPDKWQEEALNVFPSQDPDKLRMAMKACVGPGKSALLTWCGWNFLSCYGDEYDHPKGAAVSVTWENLQNNLWPEYSKWQQRDEWLLKTFKWTAKKIFAIDHPETWFLAARSWSRKADPEEQGRTLSGLHSKYVLAQIDESGDIPVAIVKAADQILSSTYKYAKIMQAGNPSSKTGLLYHCCVTVRDKWYVITITGDPEDEARSPRINLDWATEQIQLYGRDDPWIKYSILGQFPDSAINSLLSIEEIEAAMGRHLRVNEYGFAQKRLGCDVALEGDDRTVIAGRQGLAWFKPAIMRTQEPADISARLQLAKANFGSEVEFVDCTGGFGSGVVSHLAITGNAPIKVNFASKSTKEGYFNKRAEMWFEMAKAVKGGASLPKNAELAKELAAPTYSFRNGKIIIEPKEQIKKRLGYSPDVADAYALTFAMADQPASAAIDDPIMLALEQRNKHQSEYDPYSKERIDG